MARKSRSTRKEAAAAPAPAPAGRPSSLIDTRIIYCGDCLDQLRKFPDACVDLIYIDPPFNSNRNYEVFWGETKEKRAFEDRHASMQAYIEYMRPRCVELARVAVDRHAEQRYPTRRSTSRDSIVRQDTPENRP